MSEFDVKANVTHLEEWIQEFFAKFPTKKVVIGISGGKDSTTIAKLLCNALGKNLVIGVSMPNGTQYDMADVDQVFDLLGIQRITININHAYCDLIGQFSKDSLVVTEQTRDNLPARLRMVTLYMVAQSLDALVVNTCNLSEDYIGWSTKWGDSVGDFSVFTDYTKTEVCQIGEYLGLPKNLVHKAPSDGLCGRTDEDAFGFIYDELDAFLRGQRIDPNIERQIRELHLNRGVHKDLSNVLPHPHIV